MSPIYLTTIFLTLINLSTGSKPRPQPDLCPKPNPENILFPQYNPTSGSIFSNVLGVVTFTNTFRDAVYKSDKLRNVFDLSQSTALEYSEFVYKFNFELYKLLGFKTKYASSIAEFASRAIALNFDVITMPLMVNVLGNTAVNYLFVEGVLTTGHAENLAFKFIETLHDVAEVYLTADPTSKFQILAISFFKFISAVNEKAMETAQISTYYYGNEWFVAAVNYKWLNQH